MRVWVNGTFDVIHAGHIDMLRHASLFGKVRVGLDTDERVKSLKGQDRPINTLRDRLTVIDSIKFVDSYVFFGSDEELIKHIKLYNPDIIVVGAEYKGRVIGGDLALVIYYDRVKKLSSTSTIEKLGKCIK